MKKVAILARQAGVGKTTICLHLAILATERAIATCVIDCDPKQSALAWYQDRPDDEPPVVDGYQAEGRRLDRTGSLARMIRVAETDEFELAIIDTAPEAAGALGEAARAADFCVVPCCPAHLDSAAMSQTIATLAASQTPYAVLLNACPPARGIDGDAAIGKCRDLLDAEGVPLFRTAVSAHAIFGDALRDGHAVTERAPDSPAAAEIGEVLDELLAFLN